MKLSQQTNESTRNNRKRSATDSGIFCYCCLKLYHIFLPPEPQQTTKKKKEITETDKEIETYYIGRTIYIHY